MRPDRLTGPNESAPLRFWVLTDEGSVDTCDTLSLVGLFSTVDKARAYLAEWVIGAEIEARIVWEQAPDNDGFWEGHDPEHDHCYVATRHTTDDIDHGAL